MTPNVVLATFVDPNPLATAGDYMATIHWGDGSTDPGLISLAGAVSGGPAVLVQVSGAHRYLEALDYAVSVTITDVDAPNVPQTAAATIHVADASLSAIGAPISATEGVALTKVPVAIFTDSNPLTTAADFPNVTIDWGDGTTSPGTVAANGTAPNGVSFVVTGSHTYNDDDTVGTEVESSQVIVTIHDQDGSVAVAATRATEQDPVLTDPGVDVQATEGTAFTGVVSTFSDTNLVVQAGDFTTTIDWGDGTTSSSMVTATSPGHFSVAGTHTYTAAGSFTIGVTIRDKENNMVSDSSTATVADAPLSAQGIPLVLRPKAMFRGALASFSDGNPGASASQFRATIAWGDGTTTTGTVGAQGATFLVTGAHTYSREGSFPITITIVDQGGSHATAAASAHVGKGVTAAVKLKKPHGQTSHSLLTHPRGPLAQLNAARNGPTSTTRA
jgi:hypothetical protein